MPDTGDPVGHHQLFPYPAHSDEAQQALRYRERHYETRTFVPPAVRPLLRAEPT